MGSRTYVEQNGEVKWTEGDKLYVYGPNVSGVLTLSEGAKTKDGKFTGFVFGNPDNLQWAVFGDDVKFTADGAQFTIKEITDPNSNSPMVGAIGSGSVQMEHLCGMVRLTINNLPQNATVTLGGTGIAGTAEVKNGEITDFTLSNSIVLKAVEGSDNVFEVPVFATDQKEEMSFTLTIDGVSCSFTAPVKVNAIYQNAVVEFTCNTNSEGKVVGIEKAATNPENLLLALQQEGDVNVKLDNSVALTTLVAGENTSATIDLNGYTLTLENSTIGDNISIVGIGTIAGVNPTENVTNDDFQVMDNGNETYTIIPSGINLSLVANNYPGLYTDNKDYYVYDPQGLISMNEFWADNWCGNNMWGRSYNIMADIKADGYTWNSVWVNVGANTNNGFVINGNNHTIFDLAINGSMFTGTPNGGNSDTEYGKVQDLTFEKATVQGDHWTAVLWGNTYGDLIVENVHVKNSTIIGNCNVAAFVGGTAIEGNGSLEVKFNNCSVENTTITANGKKEQDPNGANAFLSRAYALTKVTFEGTNSILNNTIVNKNGLKGGGIYGYTIWANGGFDEKYTGTCEAFTNWSGLHVVSNESELKSALNISNNNFIIAYNIENTTIKLPSSLENVTIKAANGIVIKNSTISAADGNSYNYSGLTFDGIVFENSRLLFTGWRNGEEVLEDFTITNCVFRNLSDNTNTAPVHINKDASEAVKNFTFTNNVIDGATGGQKSGVYAQLTGNIVFENNVINNVSFRPYVIQVTINDGINDEFKVTGNTFSGSANGRAQGLGNDSAGTDNVNIVVSGNIFKGITGAQQICYWNFNADKAKADLSKNYYDINIEDNPSKIYYNSAAASKEDLKNMGVYPYYTRLNADGTIDVNSLKEAK